MKPIYMGFEEMLQDLSIENKIICAGMNKGGMVHHVDKITL